MTVQEEVAATPNDRDSNKGRSKKTSTSTNVADADTDGTTGEATEDRRIASRRKKTERSKKEKTPPKQKIDEKSTIEQNLEDFFNSKEIDYTLFLEKAKGLDGKTICKMLNINLTKTGDPKENEELAQEHSGNQDENAKKEEDGQVTDGDPSRLSDCSVNLGQRVENKSPVKVPKNNQVRLSEDTKEDESHGEEGDGHVEVEHGDGHPKVEHGDGHPKVEDGDAHTQSLEGNESGSQVTDAELDGECEDGVYISDSDVCERLSAINKLKEMELTEEEYTSALEAIEDKFIKSKEFKAELAKKKELEQNKIDGCAVDDATGKDGSGEKSRCY